MCKCGHMAVWHKFWSGKCEQGKCPCSRWENGKDEHAPSPA